MIHCISQITKQFFVVDNIAEILALAIQSVDPADGLEQAMIVHRLVDVQVGAAGGIEARQELIHDDQQLHIRRFFHELPLSFLFEFCHLACDLAVVRFGINTDHLQVGVVFFKCFGILVIADCVRSQITGLGCVGGNDRTLPKALCTEDFVVSAGGVDGVCHQNGISVAIHQPCLRPKIENDIIGDFLQTRLGGEHLLKITPVSLQLCLCSGRKTDGLGIEPGIDSGLRGNILRDISGFIAQIQHDTVPDTFVEFVGMDVAAEGFQTGLLVLFQKRCAGEADENGIGKDGFHGLVEFAGLGTVTLIHKDHNIALGTEILRQSGKKLADVLGIIRLRSLGPPLAEFMYQGADQPILVGIQPGQQILAALGADDLLVHTLVVLFDLFVQFFTVGDDQDTGVGVVRQDPLGEPHHRQALAAALGVPDDAASVLVHQTVLSPLDGIVLVIAADLFDALVEDDKVVDQVEEPLLVEHDEDLPLQLSGNIPAEFLHFQINGIPFVGMLFEAIVLPFEVMLLRGQKGAVAQALAVITGHAELHGGEEFLDEVGLLVGEILADAVGDRDTALFQLDHRQGDAVDIDHQIRPLGVVSDNGNFLGDVEVIGQNILKVDEIHRLRGLVGCLLDLCAVFEQGVDLLVGVIQPLLEVGRGLGQRIDGIVRQLTGTAALQKPRTQEVGHDVAVLPIMQVAQICIVELVLKELDHTVLGLALAVANVGHVATSS